MRRRRWWEESWPDWAVALALFIFLSSLYFATVSGITSSNDGSHYALTRTMLENGRFTLESFDDYAEGNDIAIRDGQLYSDRPPGAALAATLFYSGGGWLPEPLTPLPSRHDPGNPRLLYVLLLPVWAGAGTIALLYLFLRQLEVARVGVLLAGLAVGLGTIHWKYSSVLFSHALSGFLVMLSLWLAVRWGRRPGRPLAYGLLGFILGLAVLVEYSNGLLVLIVGLYLLWRGRPWAWTKLRRVLGPFVLGGLGPALFLAFYNSVNFGGPFTLSYAYAVNYPWAGDFAVTFSTPLPQGLQAMLIWGEGGGWCGGPCYNQGLFLLSPVLLLALPGLLLFARRSGEIFTLTMGTFLVYLLLFSAHHTAHGFTGDGRYLAPFIPLLGLPLGYTLSWLYRRLQRDGRRVWLNLLVFGLLFLSWRQIMLHIGLSFNYQLELSQLEPFVAAPGSWRALYGQVFPNAGNLPLLWLLEGMIILLCWGGKWWRER